MTLKIFVFSTLSFRVPGIEPFLGMVFWIMLFSFSMSFHPEVKRQLNKLQQGFVFISRF